MLTESYVRDRYNEISKMFDLKMPVDFIIDDSLECPVTANTKEKSEIKLPIKGREESTEDLLWLDNTIAHELSHAEFWELCNEDVKEGAAYKKHTINHIAFHMLSEYYAYDKADRLFHERMPNFRTEREIQSTILSGGTMLYYSKNFGPQGTYLLMLDYFDNIFRCYYSHDRAFTGCAEGFTRRLNEYVDLLKDQKIQKMGWGDFEGLYYKLIGILFADLPDRKADFINGIETLLAECKETKQ